MKKLLFIIFISTLLIGCKIINEEENYPYDYSYDYEYEDNSYEDIDEEKYYFSYYSYDNFLYLSNDPYLTEEHWNFTNDNGVLLRMFFKDEKNKTSMTLREFVDKYVADSDDDLKNGYYIKYGISSYFFTDKYIQIHYNNMPIRFSKP